MYSAQVVTAKPVVSKLSYSYFVGMLAGMIALLVVISYSMQVYKFVFNPEFFILQKLDVDGKNIPAFFSTFLLTTTATLLSGIAFLHFKLSKRFAMHWFGLSAVFFYLAVDELISLHEIFIYVMRRIAQSDKGIFHLGWVIPMGIFFVIFGFIYLKFLIHLPKRTRILFILSGATFVFGALGLEIIGSYYYQLTNDTSLGFQTFITIEETLEMSGITLFIYTLLDYSKRFVFPLTLQIRFVGDSRK